MGIAEITQGKAWKNFMAKLYGIGASVVIIGALFKIQHWPGAGPMLVAGLGTEAIIFFFSAFEPVHEDTDWSLVYPELAGMHGEEGEEVEEEEKGTLTEQLDNLLEDAKIGPDLIESLGAGMRNLSEQASKISDISGAQSATSEYVNNIKTAAKNVNELSSSYSKASEQLAGINIPTEDSSAFATEITKASKNLSALNASYELQLQGSSEHLKATTKLYDGIQELMGNLNDSISDTKKYKDEIAQLSSNLTALNTVYGNMLNAMSFKK